MLVNTLKLRLMRTFFICSICFIQSVACFGIPSSLFRTKGETRLRAITAIVSVSLQPPQLHKHIHEVILRALRGVGFVESVFVAHSSKTTSFSMKVYSQNDLDVTVSTIEALSACSMCRSKIPNKFIVEIAEHAVVSPAHALRLKNLPQTSRGFECCHEDPQRSKDVGTYVTGF